MPLVRRTPITCPSATRLPTLSVAITGSYVVRTEPWSMLTTGLPAIEPANATVPLAAARTASPGSAERSTPRCPEPQTTAGRANPRCTTAAARSGQPAGVGSGGAATAGPGTATTLKHTATKAATGKSRRRTRTAAVSGRRPESCRPWQICGRRSKALLICGRLYQGGLSGAAGQEVRERRPSHRLTVQICHQV